MVHIVILVESPNSVSSIPNFNLNTLSLAPGTYAIVVSAFNTAGNESGFSNEINWTNRIPAVLIMFVLFNNFYV